MTRDELEAAVAGSRQARQAPQGVVAGTSGRTSSGSVRADGAGRDEEASMTIDPAFRYEGMSPKAYEHPADRAATAALRSIPLMDQFVRRLCDFGHERRLRQVLLGNAVRIGEDQVPDLWASYANCAWVLDLERTPDLYVTQTPLVNAMTVGAQNPVVIVYSSLVGSYEPLEVRAVLAHELGHVLSEHYAYTTALLIISQVVQGALPRSLFAGLPIRALYLALLEWSRMAELSSDRAAALVLGDPLPVCQMLMRTAGGALPGMSLDAFMRPGHRVRGRGRHLLPSRPVLGGGRSTASLRGPSCAPTGAVGE